MILREPCLPPGWYPRDRDKIGHFLEIFKKPGVCRAASAPHAGWYYSGLCAASAVSSLKQDADTVVVIGGHLGAGMPLLVAAEDGVKTPLGTMKMDEDLREAFKSRTETRPDRYQDNTVEVLLPMVNYFFPHSELLWLRFPAEIDSFDAGKILAECAVSTGRKIVVLASTDLTHYGSNYGFSPMGRGKAALEWVKNVNDAAFISAVLEGDPNLVLERANKDFSSCSAGAVLGALGFAAEEGLTERRLLDYRTSADMKDDFTGTDVPDSFVGYAAIGIS